MKTPRSLKTKLVPIALALALQSVTQAQNFTPIPLTPGSFTANMVIPVDWTYKLNNQSVTVTIDHGAALQTDTVAGFPTYYSVLSGDTFFEMGMERANATQLGEGVPAGGTLLTNVTTGTVAPHIYQLPYWTNYASNCTCIAPYTNGFTYNSQPLPAGPYAYPTNNPYYNPHLALNNTTPFTALSFLTTSGGPFSNYVTIQYADGTSQGPVLFAVPNWFVNAATYVLPGGAVPTNTYAYSAAARCNPAENANNFTISSGVTSGSRLWSADIALTDTTSYPTNLIFNCAYFNNAAGTIPSTIIIAVSGSTNPSDNTGANTAPNTTILAGPFAPIPVSGYNAGFVVANSPQTYTGLAPLTATMDNGTNVGKGANTFFEIGWDQAAPTNGFPIHGSTITSAAFPTRTYQMPASYHQAMCTLIDTNHPLISITPQTPGIYTAFSLLTAGASINNGNRMTNFIILQHSDGVQESNIFIGYDWFETSQPYAYACQERCNIGSTTSTSGREVQNLDGTSPRLFDSEFQMFDSTPVTNILVGYLVAPAAASTTYIIAVSATTNIIPPLVSTYTPAQNVFAGQSAVFTIGLSLGSFPVYQWQYTDGATFTNNLPNGPSVVPGSTATISGATTTNLTISGVSSADAAYLYTCLVTNTAGSINSPFAVLSIRTSTLGNMLQPGDLLSDFVGNPPNQTPPVLASPAGLLLTNVEDGTLAAYLNYGVNGNTAGPFQGDVGFVVTPQSGSSVVSALRFYTAVNASICDPADFMLEGSTDGGNTWATIVADELLSLPVERNLATSLAVNVTNQVLQEVDFANSTAYTTYRVTVENVRSNAVANSMQIAEIQLLGTQSPVAPGILVQPAPTNKTIIAGGSFSTSLTASGPTNYFYQWYWINGGVTNGVANATNASVTVANVQASGAGAYFCIVSNLYGSVTSSNVYLTVLSTNGNQYVSTIMADGPLAYWRLDEGNGVAQTEALLAGAPNGGNGYLPANDYAGNHNGIYTNADIGISPGYSTNDADTAAGFGNLYITAQDSFVGQVPAINNFVATTNQKSAFSVEAWVQAGSFQSIGGAGIVTYGYGGGGEQFALDCGGTTNAYRFYFRDATLGTNVFGNPSHNCVAPANARTDGADGLWHYVVGVLDEFHTNEYLYVDGQLVQTTALATNLGVQYGSGALSIGARSSASTTNHNLQFNGSIDEVALYPYALSSTQVLNHYYAAGIAPVITLEPTNITVNQGANGTFVAGVAGSPLLALQWYGGAAGSPVILPGQTNATLTLTNVQPAQNGNQYYLSATNTYGSNSSDTVTLTVESAPTFLTDLQTSYTFLAGYPFSLPTVVAGAAPLTYGWYYNTSTVLQNGGRISGAHSNVLTIANAQLSDAGTYQVFATNPVVAPGSVASMLANVSIVPVLGLNGFGGGWSLNGVANYSGSNVLQLTTGVGNESASSFFGYPVYVGAFEASWTYTDVGGNGADGACFVIQNAAAGASALGGGGGSLGLVGITNSADLQFNIYSGNAFGGVGYAFTTNGALANVTDPFPLNIASGDPIFVKLSYLKGIVSMVLTDTVAGGSYSTSISVNLASAVGGTTAYVGFTGSDGGTASTQTINDFNFVSLPSLTVQSTTPSLIVLSWPTGVGAYVLQQSPSLLSPSWSNVGGTVTQVGALNEETVSTTGAATYYRLDIQYTPQ